MSTNTPSSQPADRWASGAPYEAYVGRWSRHVARQFLAWLDIPAGKRWLDVGSGTGALSQTILQTCQPEQVIGVDRSEGFVGFARQQLSDDRVRFEVADAQSLPVEDSAFDCAVSGLVLNFVPQHDRVISEMKRAVAADGIVAVYVWDYADKMEFMRYFWDAASALDPANSSLDEGSRFPICHPNALTSLFESIGLKDVSTTPIDIATNFKDFDDYWQPFLGAQGSAPSYVQTLTEAQRIALRDRLRDTLPSAADGSISLIARAWAARGRK